MNRKEFETMVILELSILFLIIYIYFPGSLLNTLLGLPFVLILPGYALVEVVYRSDNKFDLPQRLAISCVMSLTFITILSMGLNAIGYLSTLRQIIGIELIIIVSCIVVFYRRFHRKKEIQFVKEQAPHNINKQFNSILIGTIVVVVVSLTVLGMIINLISEEQAPSKTTAFYLLGEGGKAGNYPTQVNLGSPFPITIGIINKENERTTYFVDVQINKQDPRSLAMVVLNPGEKWEQSFNLTIEQTIESEALVSFNLHKGSEGKVHRSLHFWTQIIENDLVSYFKTIMNAIV